MATRGVYHFYDSVEDLNKENPVASIYRHWDNYLEGGGVDLKEFLETLRDTDMDDRFYDAPYLSAKFVVYLAMIFANDWQNNALDFLSVGVVKPKSDWGQDYDYHIVSQTQENGLPLVVFDSYDEEKKDLFEALEEL